MRTIKMLVSAHGYNDVNGINQGVLNYYEEGQSYQVGDYLAEALLNSGAAVEEHGEKAHEAAPENKALTKAPENKRRGKK